MTKQREELTHNEQMEQIISKQLKPFIILASVLISIFGIIAVPIASQVLILTRDQSRFEFLLNEKADKTELKKYLPTKDAIDIYKIRDEYYRDIFVLNPKSKLDSSNYNLLVKTIFGANSRSGNTLNAK